MGNNGSTSGAFWRLTAQQRNNAKTAEHILLIVTPSKSKDDDIVADRDATPLDRVGLTAVK